MCEFVEHLSFCRSFESAYDLMPASDLSTMVHTICYTGLHITAAVQFSVIHAVLRCVTSAACVPVVFFPDILHELTRATESDVMHQYVFRSGVQLMHQVCVACRDDLQLVERLARRALTRRRQWLTL